MRETQSTAVRPFRRAHIEAAGGLITSARVASGVGRPVWRMRDPKLQAEMLTEPPAQPWVPAGVAEVVHTTLRGPPTTGASGLQEKEGFLRGLRDILLSSTSFVRQ